MDREAMKHTPGPWYIDPIKAHANGNRRIMAEQCTPVAIVPEHLAADARLIAAAPQLLEALQDVCARLLYRGVSTNAGHPDRTAFEIARAAIAKATGGDDGRQPLYTTPAKQWVGLTDEEHAQIAIDSGCASADWIDYAKKIEAKLKEKNT